MQKARKGITAALAAGLLGAAGIALPLTAETTASAAQQEGCGYGEGGPLAETICWIDMSDFDPALAGSPDGQKMTVNLSEGDTNLTLSFTAKLAPGRDGLRKLIPTKMPTWGGTPIGNSVYRNTPGKPVLYQEPGANGGWLGKMTLDDLVVKQNGVEQGTGYALVMADAESSNKFEGFTFTSDAPINQVANITPAGYNPACGSELSGLGTTSVTCMGQGVANAGDIVTSTDNPTSVSIEVHNDNDPVGNVNKTQQGFAFGVAFAKLEVSKKVVGRYHPADQFTVLAYEPPAASPPASDARPAAADAPAAAGAGFDPTIARATTSGTGEQVSTGGVPFLTTISPTRVYFTEEMAPGSASDLSKYSQQWACTRNGTPLPSSEFTIEGTTKRVAVDVNVSDFVSCEVTNTAKLGAVTWTKTNAKDASLLDGSSWRLDGPDGFTRNVTDGDANDLAKKPGELSLGGLPWGDYSLVETRAPQGFSKTDRKFKFTVSEGVLSIDLGQISNSATPVKPTEPPVKPTEPPVKPTEPLAKTGGSDLTGALLAGVGLLGIGVLSMSVARRRAASNREQA